MRLLCLLCCTLFLGACATVAPPTATDGLFHDALFAPPTASVDAAQVFALSEPMRRYLETDIEPQFAARGVRQGLVDALYRKGQLQLEYDASRTRNAAEAFAARAGNCLSLVILTAAYARELELPIRFQKVVGDDTWSRSGDIYFSAGHVNISLGRRRTDIGTGRSDSESLIVDFLPTTNLRLHTLELSEATIVAMYLNNRAVEAMADGELSDAYWWAREAIRHDPRFMSAHNTLGAIYLRGRHYAEAERVFRHVLEREPANTRAMSNQVSALGALGRNADADALARRLAAIEPEPPFAFFDRGVEAMRRGEYRAARDLFNREIAREAYYHEFRFWLALAHLALGDSERARAELELAMDASATRGDRDRYAAKLDKLRAAIGSTVPYRH